MLISQRNYVNIADEDSSIDIPYKLDNGDRCKICHTITNITCINCNIGVCIDHLDIHKMEVNTKGVHSVRYTFKLVCVANEGLDLKICLKYLFKKL